MIVPTMEIPQDQWPDYFSDMSKQCQGWGVTIEVMSGEIGDMPAAQGAPLLGLSSEKAGTRAGEILVEVGDAGTSYAVHHIDRPRRVHTLASAPGSESYIQLESEDGVVTLVRLRRRPELPPA